jgi:hypothetical protein
MMIKPTHPITLRAIAFQEGEFWSAQCLEYDIAAQAKKLTDLFHELRRVVAAHVVVCRELGRDPFDGLAQAPRYFWDLWDRANVRIETDDDDQETDITPAILPAIKLAETRAAC